MTNPNDEAYAILKTMTREQRGALAHLLNNALAPLAVELEVSFYPVATPVKDALARLRDVVRHIVNGGR